MKMYSHTVNKDMYMSVIRVEGAFQFRLKRCFTDNVSQVPVVKYKPNENQIIGKNQETHE